MRSRFVHLLTSRRFAPLFVTQFFGAFNDNLLKSALGIFATFIVWFIANNVGGHEPLHTAPVNAWAATLILAVALDLGGSHARQGGRRR